MDTNRQNRRHGDIGAHEVTSFEVWLGAEVIGTERGYGLDHDGATIEVAPILESVVLEPAKSATV